MKADATHVALVSVIGGLLVGPITALAQLSASPPGIVARGSYDLSKLRGICGFVYSMARAPAGSGYRYTFQRMMADAAGVAPGDDPDTRRTRVRYLWLDNQQVFRCNADNFNLIDGNLLKYSAGSRSYAFLGRAIEDWQLELNFIDPADHRTILDYMSREAQANAGNSDSATIDAFLDALRHSGAKHCFELIDARHCEHADGGNFLSGRVFSAPERESAQREIGRHNDQLRVAPLRPFQPL